MKQHILRSIIKEELAKALNEVAAKFQEGDTFIYMGQKHTVVSDNGYTIEAKLPNGKIKKYNYNQIKNALNESEDSPSFLSEIEPGTYTFSYKEKDEYGDITKGIGRKVTIDADTIDKYGNTSLRNYLEVLSIWDWEKVE